MRGKATYAAAAVFAAGVVGVGAVSVLAPAWAGPGPAGPAATAPMPGHGMRQWGSGTPMSGASTGAGMGMGNGAGMGAGMGRAHGMGPGAGTGVCPLPTGVPSGTLTKAQQTTLAAMAEEEKLSHDLYQAFADRHGSALFARTATAETGHLTAVRTLLDRYGVTDPTAGKPAGQFASADVQASYDRYLSAGNASLAAALAVGEQVERASIAGLDEARDGLDAPDVALVYQHLLAASQHHLAAFTG